MNLEDQVTSIDISKRLAELCFKKESLFHWNNYYGKKFEIVYDTIFNEGFEEYYSAFTASELLELLPAVDISKLIDIFSPTPRYSVKYYDAGIIIEPEENVCNALARMLIYLIENKIINLT